MSDAFKVIVHLGLHKTGTTSLQQQVFPKLAGVKFVDRMTSASSRVIYSLGTSDPIYWDSVQARAALTAEFEHEQINLISSEALSGSLFAALGKQDLDNRSGILQNLRSTLPEARVVLVIRRQDAYAKSVYRQYVRAGGSMAPHEFFGSTADTRGHFSRDRFRYREYLRALRTAFPAGVHVGVYEHFVESPREFLGQLCAFLGTDDCSGEITRMNRSRLGAFGLEICRHANRFFHSPLNPSGLLPGLPHRRRDGKWVSRSPIGLLQDVWPGNGRIPERSALGEVAAGILEEVRENNSLLSSEWKLSLQRYGYC